MMEKKWINRILAMALVCLLAVGCLPLIADATVKPEADREFTKIVLGEDIVCVPYDGEAHGITATVTDLDCNPIEGAVASIRYVGVSNNGVTNDYDSTEAPTEIGLYQVFASYEGDDTYCGSYNSTLVVIHSYWGELSKVLFDCSYVETEYNGLPQGLTAKAYDLCCNYIGEPVIFYVTANEETPWDVICTTEVPVDAGKYLAIAVYPGDEYYAASYNFGFIHIKKNSAENPQFNVGDLTTCVGEEVDLSKVTFAGNQLADRDVATIATSIVCENETHDAANEHLIVATVPESVQKNYINTIVVNPGTHFVLEHDYVCVEHVDATCTTDGLHVFECTRCGDSYEEIIPALGHEFGDWFVTKEPTCTEAGEECQKCIRCEETNTREIAALGHDFGDWYVSKEPTATEKGEERQDCSRCDAYNTREIAPLGEQNPETGDNTQLILMSCLTLAGIIGCAVVLISGKKFLRG